MKEYQYEGNTYVTGIIEDRGWAIPVVYKKRKFLWFITKTIVYKRSDCLWVWQTAVNSSPETIEQSGDRVFALFKIYEEQWKGLEKPFK